MQWEQMTAPDFARAVQETGVCVIAMGVLERHSEHLPLGTDYLNGHKLACLATEKEPAVVFPPFYFGQIYEARCFPGALTIKPTLLIELIQGVFDEIGRNGFKKIIISNAHGGNNAMLPFLVQCSLWAEKPYTVYFHNGSLGAEREKQWNAVVETSHHGHACECETSISLANHPELVKMGCVPAEHAGDARERLAAIKPSGFSAVNWYSDYPEHYAGDARTASAEKGRILRQLSVDALSEFIAAVKADQVAPTLQAEFFAREKHLRAPND
jgi:creatinine amidohydrolase